MWDMIDDCNRNNLSKNHVSAVFHSRAIRRSMSPGQIYRALYGDAMFVHFGTLNPNGINERFSFN